MPHPAPLPRPDRLTPDPTPYPPVVPLLRCGNTVLTLDAHDPNGVSDILGVCAAVVSFTTPRGAVVVVHRPRRAPRGGFLDAPVSAPVHQGQHPIDVAYSAARSWAGGEVALIAHSRVRDPATGLSALLCSATSPVVRDCDMVERSSRGWDAAGWFGTATGVIGPDPNDLDEALSHASQWRVLGWAAIACSAGRYRQPGWPHTKVA